jgi:hypothetical protein
MSDDDSQQQYEYDFPSNFLPDLINGDHSGETDDHSWDQFLGFLDRESYIDIWSTDPDDQEEYFCNSPEFGLPCNCVKVIGVVLAK